MRDVLEAAVRPRRQLDLRLSRRRTAEPGYFQIHHAVYDRAGEPCRACGTAIKRIVLSGRSSFYCPRCQR